MNVYAAFAGPALLYVYAGRRDRLREHAKFALAGSRHPHHGRLRRAALRGAAVRSELLLADLERGVALQARDQINDALSLR